MKENLKRLMAIILTVCLLSTLFVPAAFADGSANSGSQSITYNFELQKDSTFIADATSMAAKVTEGVIVSDFNLKSTAADGVSVENWFKNSYGTKINWRPVGTDSTAANSYDNYKKFWRFNGATGDGLQMRVGANKYVAFMINVPEAGEYSVDLTAGAGSHTMNIYMFKPDASFAVPTNMDGLTAANTAITAAKTSENCVGEGVATTANTTTSNAFEVTCAEAGDYVIVFELVTGTNSRIRLRNMVLNPVNAEGGTTTESTAASEGTTAPAGTTTPETTAPAGTTAPEDTTAPEETTAPVETLPPEDLPAPGTVMATYNFDMKSSTDPMISKYDWSSTSRKINKPVVLADGTTDTTYSNYTKLIQALYADENCSLNWGIHTALNNSVFADEGIRTVAPNANGGYMVFYLDAPLTQAVEYKVSLTVTSSRDDANIYLLKENADLTTDLTAENLLFGGTVTATGTFTDTVTLSGERYLLVVDHVVPASATKNFYFSIANLTLSIPDGEQEETQPSTAPAPEYSGGYTEGVYNFALFREEGRKAMFTTADGKLSYRIYNQDCYHCGAKIRDCLKAQYAANEINWILEGTTFGELRFVADTYASTGKGGMQMRYITDENGNMIPSEKDPKKNAEGPGSLVAFRIKVANPGTYTVTFDKDYPYGCTADMYILPAPQATMTKAELAAAVTEANFVGQARVTADVHSCDVVDYEFKTAGEYIILMKAVSNRIYLNTITLSVPKVLEPIPTVKEKIYNFNLTPTDPVLEKKAMVSRYNKEGTLRTYNVLKNWYDADEIFWKYETASATFGQTVCSFRANYLRFKSTVNFRDLEEQWIAFRIKNPGTGTYDIRLVSKGGKSVADIYLIPAASAIGMTAEEVKAAMTSENRLVKGAIFDKKDTFYLGEYTFGMEEEYVLVFDFQKGLTLYLDQIQMTLDGVKADGTVKKEKVYNGTVYDFDMADPLNGYFTENKTYLRDVKGDLEAMWRSGVLNWKWETASEGLRGTSVATMMNPSSLTRFYSSGGMRVLTFKDQWNAFRIKSPGSGTFTLSINHAVMTAGGTMAVYILPGDTEDVEFAMDPKNRIGKVIMYNDGVDTTVKDGSTTYLGYYEFEAGKEYIVVFEHYDTSPFADTAYINVSQLIAERGKVEYETGEADKTVKAVTVLENAIVTADTREYCYITEVYGHDYYILPMEAGVILVYDLDTGELVDKFTGGFRMPGVMAQDQDGIVWMGGSGPYMLRYDPYNGTLEQTPKFSGEIATCNGASALAVGPDGKIYFYAYYGGYVCSYDPETKEYKVLDLLVPGLETCSPGFIYDGYWYLSPYTAEKTVVVKYDLAKEEVVATTDISHLMGGVNRRWFQLRMLGDGDLIISGCNGYVTTKAFAIDPKTMEIVDVPLWGGLNLGITEEVNGKQYMCVSGYGLYEYDVETKEFTKTPGFGTSGIGFRSCGNNVITLDGETVLATFSSSGGLRLYNLDTKEYSEWNDLVVHGDGGADIRAVAKGLGENEIYMGVFNKHEVAVYDTELGVKTGEFKTGGQTDSMVVYKDKVYTGNYSITALYEMYLEGYDFATKPASNDLLRRWQLDHDETRQKRVHKLAAGDDRIFAGTIPDTGYYGGALVVFDTKTGQWYYERNIVPECAVTGLAYSDKLIYGATSRSGGTETAVAAEDENRSAKIFVYDYENRKTLATLDPRDYISGLTGIVSMIVGLEADPVVEGRMWAVVSETLFCFTFDRETLTFDVQEVISFGKNTYDTSATRSIWTRPILFDTENNYLYFSFDHGGGMQCIELADWNASVGSVKVKSNQRIMSARPLTYVLGNDGNLYYGKNGNLMMFPLNVTDEDWAIAGAVDKMITDLGEITLESEADIKSARSAYDNMNWRYRALVNNLELLQESETDLLECKIDAIVLEDVGADSLPQLQEYMDTYEGMNARQQKYVKNYAKFKEAYDKASGLNNQRVAAALQKRIDALKDKFPLTLDHEPEVVQIRDDYDLMTGKQRGLVDITILEDAEAQIKVLRAEFVIYVEELIQAIPEEITLADEEVITKASEAADKLYVNERKQISYSKLTSAESKLRALLNAKAAADEVDALIKEIGIVTLGDKDRIAAAREAYDALNKTALDFVTKAKKLETAEFILKALQTWGIPAITVANAGIVFAVIWFVPSLHSKVFKTKKKEEVEEPTEG